MTAGGGPGPQLVRVGSARPARLGALVGLALLVGAAGIALADRLPLERQPRPSFAVQATSPSPSASPSDSPLAMPSPPAAAQQLNALDRGNGWPTLPGVDTGAGFEVILLSYQVVMDEVRLARAAGEANARLAVPAATWHTPAWLQLRWRGGDGDAGGQQLAMVALSLGSSADLGLPIDLASGRALLPRPLEGTRHWDWAISLERAHAFSTPEDWIAVVRLGAAEPPTARQSSPAAPLILLTASPGHPQRATRVHGSSWVAGR